MLPSNPINSDDAHTSLTLRGVGVGDLRYVLTETDSKHVGEDAKKLLLEKKGCGI